MIDEGNIGDYLYEAERDDKDIENYEKTSQNDSECQSEGDLKEGCGKEACGHTVTDGFGELDVDITPCGCECPYCKEVVYCKECEEKLK